MVSLDIIDTEDRGGDMTIYPINNVLFSNDPFAFSLRQAFMSFRAQAMYFTGRSRNFQEVPGYNPHLGHLYDRPTKNGICNSGNNGSCEVVSWKQNFPQQITSRQSVLWQNSRRQAQFVLCDYGNSTDPVFNNVPMTASRSESPLGRMTAHDNSEQASVCAWWAVFLATFNPTGTSRNDGLTRVFKVCNTINGCADCPTSSSS